MKEKESKIFTAKNKSKNLIFYLILLFLPFLFFIFLEITLRLFEYGTDLRLFIKSSNYKGYYETNQLVCRRYFSKSNGGKISRDLFLIDKPDTAYRIFVMGESTTRGFPYQSGISFPRILYYRLQEVFPNKRIEIINTGMDAVNSYAIYDLLDDIFNYKPDAILIYAGHNEYYGALGVGSVENGGNFRGLKLLHLRLVHLRTFQLIQNIINSTLKHLFSVDYSLQSGTLMERIVKDKAIELNSEKYNAGIEQFRANMERVLTKAKNSGIPVILSELVSNVRDIKPFKSVDSKLNPRADGIYYKACGFESKGDFTYAKKLFYEAKELDALRFRAPEEINNVLHQLGKKFSIPVVPMKLYFEDNSSYGLIGNKLMMEHLHPNIDGYFLMADAFFNTMKKNGLINRNWDTTLIKPLSYYRKNWGFSPIDSLLADIRIRSLKAGWPFQSDTIVNNFLSSYRPISEEDSMAFMCIKYDNIYIEDQHKKLIKKYESEGKFIKAYNEYNSLIKSYPYLYPPYINAAKCLMKAKEYNKAEYLLLSLPGVDTCYYALMQLSVIFLKTNPTKAVSYLEKADKFFKPEYDRGQYLRLLYDAYNAVAYIDKALRTLEEIRAIDPGFRKPKLNSQNPAFVVSPEIKNFLDEAGKLAQAGKLEQSLKLLYKADKVQENYYIKFLIGDILFQRKDVKALPYLEKAYSYDSSNPELLKRLCTLYIVTHKYDLASKRLNELKLLSSDTANIQRLTKTLEKAIQSGN